MGWLSPTKSLSLMKWLRHKCLTTLYDYVSNKVNSSFLRYCAQTKLRFVIAIAWAPNIREASLLDEQAHLHDVAYNL